MPDPTGTVAPPNPAASGGTTPPAAPAPFYADLFTQDGKINHASFERLPEDVRYLKDSFSKYDTADSFIRGIANQQTLAGKKGLIPLPANAPAEAIAERKALLDSINGVPKEPKEYGFKRPENFSEKHWDQKLADQYAAWAHKHSVSPSAAQELIKQQMEAVNGNLAAQAAYEKEFYAKHDQTFAESVRQMNMPLEKANALAENAAKALGLDLTKEANQRMLKNADLRMAMVKHALATGEDQFVNGDPATGAGGDAMTQMKDIIENPANPLNAPLRDPRHPQHAMAKEKVEYYARRAQAALEKAGAA